MPLHEQRWRVLSARLIAAPIGSGVRRGRGAADPRRTSAATAASPARTRRCAPARSPRAGCGSGAGASRRLGAADALRPAASSTDPARSPRRRRIEDVAACTSCSSDVRRDRIGLRVVVDVDVEAVHHVEARIARRAASAPGASAPRRPSAAGTRVKSESIVSDSTGGSAGAASARALRPRPATRRRGRRLAGADGRGRRRGAAGRRGVARRLELAPRPALAARSRRASSASSGIGIADARVSRALRARGGTRRRRTDRCGAPCASARACSARRRTAPSTASIAVGQRHRVDPLAAVEHPRRLVVAHGDDHREAPAASAASSCMRHITNTFGSGATRLR